MQHFKQNAWNFFIFCIIEIQLIFFNLFNHSNWFYLFDFFKDFIPDKSNLKNIYFFSVTQSLNHFWWSIINISTWWKTFLKIYYFFCYTKIQNLNFIIIFIPNNIVASQISVNYSILVHVFQGLHYFFQNW